MDFDSVPKDNEQSEIERRTNDSVPKDDEQSDIERRTNDSVLEEIARRSKQSENKCLGRKMSNLLKSDK